jgi:protein-glutamine gamma-glutamyltransferase
MSFETYFRITSYCLIAAATGALAVTGALDWVSLTAYVCALGASAYMDFLGYRRFRVREWMWRLLTILYIPFVFIDAAYISSKVVALVHMTLFVSAAKLFQDKRDRDWVFLYLIAFFQILLAASLTFNASFVASLIVYIFFFVSTLAAFEIKRSRREVVATGDEEITRTLVGRSTERHLTGPPNRGVVEGHRKARAGGVSSRMRYLFGASMVQLLLVTALTLPLFFMIPRFGGNALSSTFGDLESVSGFSDTVRLGDVASIKTSSRVVMRVKLDRPPGRWLRWRGVALDHYDGRSWTLTRFKDSEQNMSQDASGTGMRLGQDNGFQRNYPINGPDGSQYNSLSQPFPGGLFATEADANIVRQDFYLEPLNVGTLFASGKLLRIRGPMRALRVVPSSRCVSTPLHGSRIMYSAWSDTHRPSEEELRAYSTQEEWDMPSVPETIFLQLPGSRDRVQLDPRVAKLAREVTSGAPTEYDKAKAIESYLKKNYGYTLNLRPTNGDPLAEFLFETREGHCEYFATAMVILLRSLRIPARVVNGFQMGEYNDINEYYTVRERDAHSWVEAYFPGAHAWIEFDPTPSAGMNDYSHGGFIAQMRKYMDAAEVFWLDYVVTLDRDEQAGIMINLQHRLLAMKQAIFFYYAQLKLWLLQTIRYLFVQRRWGAADLLVVFLEMALVAAAIMAIYVGRSYVKLRNQSPTGYCPWWKRVFILPTWRGGWWLRRDQKRSAVLFYEQMLAILARAKLLKRADETPLEFAAGQRFGQVSEITKIYNAVRFGGAVLGDVEASKVSRLLSELKLAVRRT